MAGTCRFPLSLAHDARAHLFALFAKGGISPFAGTDSLP